MRAFVILAALALASCATKPKVYQAPDSSRIVATGQQLSGAVAQAHVAAKRAREAVRAVEGASKREGEKISILPPKLDELLRISPVELRPVIEAIQVDVSDLQAAHAQTEAQIAETQRAQSQLAEELEKATAAKNEHERAQAEFIAGAAKVAGEATSERDSRIKAETALHWYRVRWWGAWIALGTGLILSGIFAFLKFTGRLASALK